MKNSFTSKLLAEFIGTYALLFFGCGSIIIDSAATPLVFGAIVAIMIYTLGHISGAHFNPVVTIAFAITKHFPRREVLPYCFAQFCGAIAGVGTLAILFPEATNFGATIPAVASGSAFIWEMLLTFFLMFVIMAVATDTRAEGIMAGFAIGGIVALCAFTGGAATGASMNPARTLAPALLEGNFTGLWLYFTAPLAGAVLGALIYQKIRCANDNNKTENNQTGGCC